MLQVKVGDLKAKWDGDGNGKLDFPEFAQHLSKLRESGTIAVFGAQQAIDAANEKLPADKQMVVEQALL